MKNAIFRKLSWHAAWRYFWLCWEALCLNKPPYPTGNVYIFCIPSAAAFQWRSFFILAGFAAYSSLLSKTRIRTQLTQYTHRLLIPYAVYSALTAALSFAFSDSADQKTDTGLLRKILLGEEFGGLWFPLTLFIVSVSFLLLTKRSRHPAFLFGLRRPAVCALHIFPGFDPKSSVSVQSVLRGRHLAAGRLCARAAQPQIKKADLDFPVFASCYDAVQQHNAAELSDYRTAREHGSPRFRHPAF